MDAATRKGTPPDPAEPKELAQSFTEGSWLGAWPHHPLPPWFQGATSLDFLAVAPSLLLPHFAAVRVERSWVLGERNPPEHAVSAN